MITTVQKVTKGQKKKDLLSQVCQKIASEKGFSPSLNEAIMIAAESFLQDLRPSQKQLQHLQAAAQSAKMSPSQILDKAIDWASRFYESKYSSESLAKENSSDFAPGSAYQRIHEFVLKVMKKNDGTKKKEEKVFINQNYLTKNQGSNRTAIKGYLYLQQEVLEKHHKKHDLSPRHNVMVNSYLEKTSNGKGN